MFGACVGRGKRSRDATRGPSERLRDFDVLSAFPNRLSEAILAVSDGASRSNSFPVRKGERYEKGRAFRS
jgi:hypothetical protein